MAGGWWPGNWWAGDFWAEDWWAGGWQDVTVALPALTLGLSLPKPSLALGVRLAMPALSLSLSPQPPTVSIYQPDWAVMRAAFLLEGAEITISLGGPGVGFAPAVPVVGFALDGGGADLEMGGARVAFKLE